MKEKQQKRLKALGTILVILIILILIIKIIVAKADAEQAQVDYDSYCASVSDILSAYNAVDRYTIYNNSVLVYIYSGSWHAAAPEQRDAYAEEIASLIISSAKQHNQIGKHRQFNVFFMDADKGGNLTYYTYKEGD